VNGHGWTRLHIQDWAGSTASTEYPAATFRPAWTDEYHRCACHTNLCTRPATQEDLLCDECRGHPDCQSLPLDSR